MIRDTSGQDTVIEGAAGRRLKRRALIAGAAALLLLLAITWVVSQLAGVQRSVSAERLRLATVQRGGFISEISAQGRVVAAVSPTLYAPALGTVTLKVGAGQRVRRGEVLAQLVSPEITNELQREDANLQGLRATLAREKVEVQTARLQNRQTVDLARVTVEGAERELKRAQDAHRLGVLPIMEVDRRSDELRIAKVRFAHAQEEARLRDESLDFQLQSRALEVDRQRLLVENLQRRVGELNIVAPVDGIIGTLNVAQRAAVAANAPLMTVVDLSALEIEIQVPESYADSLGLEMPAEVRLGSKAFPGRVTAISPEVNNNLVTGRVAFDGDTPPELRQNQRVSVRVLLDRRDDVVQVTRGPFLDSGGGRYAYVLRDGIAVKTPIRAGAASAASVEILEGLQPGDQIVISGSDAFAEADSVRVR